MADAKDIKQYFVVEKVQLSPLKSLKPKTVVTLSVEEALPLVGANLIMPLYTAIRERLYPTEESTNLIVEAVQKLTGKDEKEGKAGNSGLVADASSSTADQSGSTAGKRKNLGSMLFENQLRKKIQEKKKTADSSK